jgi:hypothetical protein
MIPQLIEDLLLLPPAVSRGSAGCWLLTAICCMLLRKSMDQLGGIINGNDPRPLRTVCVWLDSWPGLAIIGWCNAVTFCSESF